MTIKFKDLKPGDCIKGNKPSDQMSCTYHVGYIHQYLGRNNVSYRFKILKNNNSRFYPIGFEFNKTRDEKYFDYVNIDNRTEFGKLINDIYIKEKK